MTLLQRVISAMVLGPGLLALFGVALSSNPTQAQPQSENFRFTSPPPATSELGFFQGLTQTLIFGEEISTAGTQASCGWKIGRRGYSPGREELAPFRCN